MTTEDTADKAAFDLAIAVIGHNRAAALWGEIGALQDRLERWSDATNETAPLLRDVMRDAHQLADRLETERKDEQKPYEEKILAVRSAYRPLVDRSLQVKETARQILNVHLERERLRLEQEAAEAREQAKRDAEAAEAARLELENASGFTANPVVAADLAKEAAESRIEADYAEKAARAGPLVASASGQARAAGQRTTYSARMTDGVKLARYFAKDPGVQEAALKAAKAMMRATKGTAQIPGAEVVVERNAV